MKYRLLLLSLIASNLIYAQQVVNISDGKYVYRLMVQQLSAPHYRQRTQPAKPEKKQPVNPGITVGTVKSITIFLLKDTVHKQVIIPANNETAWPWTNANKEEKFILEDINFDGNNDFRLLNSPDGYSYYCYVFQPTTGQFVMDTTLSNLTNPQFDQNKRMVYENWQRGASKGTTTYKYMDGKLTAFEEEESSDDAAKNVTTITLKKLVDGKLQVVSKVETPMKN